MKRRIKREDAVLVVIDFQEKLMPAMHNAMELEDTIIRTVKSFKELGVPIIVSQQYPKGLGETIGTLKSVLGDAPTIDKTDFSCMAEPLFLEELKRVNRKTIIVTGIESHVCVQQTVMDLLDLGYDVFVLNDAISSRKCHDKKHAIKRMIQAGAVPTTYEAVIFEMMGSAKAPEFKVISSIVK